MKVRIYSDSAYPVYGLDTDTEGWQSQIVEIPEDLYKEYEHVEAAYKAMQDKLHEIYRKG